MPNAEVATTRSNLSWVPVFHRGRRGQFLGNSAPRSREHMHESPSEHPVYRSPCRTQKWRRPDRICLGSLSSIAAGAANFLVIARRALGNTCMNHRPNIRFIDPHAERRSGDDQIEFVLGPLFHYLLS